MGRTYDADANDNHYDDKQGSLHPVSSFPGSDINIEPAWDIETGKPYIRVGVFDTGIRWSHNDLCDRNRDVFAESRVKGGWDYINNIAIEFADNNGGGVGSEYRSGHGTKVAGVIGAVRNNDKGIAGIAGGNDDAEPGVSLYSLAVREIPFLATAAEGIIDGAFSNIANSIDEGLHIGNFSWSSSNLEPNDPIGTNWSNEFKAALHSSYLNQVTSIISAGNSGVESGWFPSNGFADQLLMVVSGTGSDGQFVVDGTNGGFTSNYSSKVDVAAPGIPDLVYTLDIGTRIWWPWGSIIAWSDSKYGDFGGTSASAPHVTGVAALMMSYWNDSLPSAQNLAPEDVENLIELYATPLPGSVDIPGGGTISSSEAVGAGRLNAAEVMEHLIPPYYVVHYTQQSTFESFSLDITDQVIDFSSGALSSFFSSIGASMSEPLLAGSYVVDRHEYTATVSHDLSAGTQLLGHWKRGSSTNVLAISSGNDLSGHPDFTLENVNLQNSDVKAYTYFFKFNQDTGDSLNFWFPFNPYTEIGRMSWTLHVKYGPTSVDAQEEAKIKLYPNPASEVLSIEWEAPLRPSEIVVFDLAGRKVLSQNLNPYDPPSQKFQVDVSSLIPAMYIVRLSSDSFVQSLPFIKQ